jgi:rare lipoprotein A
MFCAGCAGGGGRDAVGTGKARRDALAVCRTLRKTVLPLAHTAALLAVAACAPSPFTTNKTEFVNPAPQAALPVHHPSIAAVRHEIFKKKSNSVVVRKNSDKPTDGIASFYTEDEETASGEKYNPHALTAAHRSLPFGTRVRVTNLTNGHSVVVRVNDRGPFVPGRVVDLSYSAAESLGMVERGIVKVKLDVVH